MEAVKYKTMPKHIYCLKICADKQTNKLYDKTKKNSRTICPLFFGLFFKIVIRETFPKFWHIAQQYLICFNKNIISLKNRGGTRSQCHIATWCPIPNF